MITYRLYKYGGAKPYEEIVFENEDEDIVANKALELSFEDNEYSKTYGVGFWHYRLEKIDNGERVGGWRVFNNGIEFTSRIIEIALGINEE